VKLRTAVVRGKVVVVAPGPLRDHPRGNTFEPTRKRVAARHRWRCWHCRKPIDPALKRPHPRALAVHHVDELANGGSDADANLAPMHAECHRGEHRR
jgi:hypothetical protein